MINLKTNLSKTELKKIKTLYKRSFPKSERKPFAMILRSCAEQKGVSYMLPNLAWDINGMAYELEYLKQNEIKLKINGKYPNITSIDRFPKFLVFEENNFLR